MVKVERVKVNPPSELLTCAREPVPPVTKSQDDLAPWLRELADAGADCRDKLDAVRKFVQSPN